MSVILRLVVHIPDADAALAALRQVTSRVSHSDFAGIAGDKGLAATFTREHVLDLVADRREDLAGFILAFARDPGLAEDCLRAGLPAKLYRPLVQNPVTPTRVVLEVARDPRKSVRSPALSALASRCGLPARHADKAQILVSGVFDAPDDLLLDACVEATNKASTQAALSTALSVALERPGCIPSEVLDFIKGAASRYSLDEPRARLLTALSRYGHVSTEELVEIARRRESARLPWVEALTEEFLQHSACLALPDRHWVARQIVESRTRPDPRAAALLSPQDAYELATEPLALARGDRMSYPQMVSADVRALVSNALRGTAMSRLTSPVLAHPGVDGDLLDQVWSRACIAAETTYLGMLAQNPNLQPRHWEEFLTRVSAADLTRSMSLFARSASFAQAATEIVAAIEAARPTATPGATVSVEVFGTHLAVPCQGWEWAMDRAIEALCENPAVSDEDLARLPARVLNGRWLTRPMLARLAALVYASLGAHEPAWQIFATLEETWEDSLKSLLETSQSL